MYAMSATDAVYRRTETDVLIGDGTYGNVFVKTLERREAEAFVEDYNQRNADRPTMASHDGCMLAKFRDNVSTRLTIDRLASHPAYEVAVKCIVRGNEDEGTTCTTIREIAHLKALGDHPNVATLLDHRTFGRGQCREYEACLVFERAWGPLQKLGRAGSIIGKPCLPSLVILQQMCEAVRYMHARGILHRDIKPANILVKYRGGDSWHVELADFGLSRHFDPERMRNDTEYGISGEVCTIWYRPIELLLPTGECKGMSTLPSKRQYGSAIDVWSLGCTIAEFLTGRALFSPNIERGCEKDNVEAMLRYICRAFGSVAVPKQTPTSDLGRAFCKYMDSCADATDGWYCMYQKSRAYSTLQPSKDAYRLLLQPTVDDNVRWSTVDEYVVMQEGSYALFANTEFYQYDPIGAYVLYGSKVAPAPPSGNMTHLPPTIWDAWFNHRLDVPESVCQALSKQTCLAERVRPWRSKDDVSSPADEEAYEAADADADRYTEAFEKAYPGYMWSPAESRIMYDLLTGCFAYDPHKRITAEQLVNGIERMIQAVKTRNEVHAADNDKTCSSNCAADDPSSSGPSSAGSSSSTTDLPSAIFSTSSSSSNSADFAPGIVGMTEESMDVDVVAKCAEQRKAEGKLRKMPGLGTASRLTKGLVSVCLVCTLRHGANYATAKIKWRRWKNSKTSKTPTYLCAFGHLKDHKEAAERMRLSAEEPLEPLVPSDTGDMMRV